MHDAHLALHDDTYIRWLNEFCEAQLCDVAMQPGNIISPHPGDRRRGDDDRPPRRMEEVGPSRADESDDWGRDRKFVSDGGPSRGGGGFGGSFNDRQPRGEYVPSRADEADSWGRTSPLPPAAGGEQRGFGGSFNDRPRRQYDLGSNRADEADTWGRREPLPSTGRSTPDSADRWAGGDRADRAERWGSERPASREDVPPRERPRLVLKPRSVPVDEAPAPAPLREANGATPADSARPKGSSLFGAARPREEVLKAKGLPIDDDPEQQKTALAGVLESLQQQAEVDAEALVSVEVLGGKELPVGDAVAQVQRKIDALSVGGGSGGSAVERKEAAATMRAW